MKTTSASRLFHAFHTGSAPEPGPAVDYWGDHIGSEYERALIYSVYKGMYLMDVSEAAFHEHFLKNKLDEFIHKAYSKRSSGYYREFVNKNIKIGKTFIDF